MHVDEDKVRDRAYELWEREGRPEGAANSHWKQAADEIKAEADDASNADTQASASGGVESGVAQPMPKP
ncbi:DUF2934 domain-containing protein [Pseudomonas sp. RIT-PI-S]|uniref:DUF2934 domain-containing protein n=1 Tax=Pseudomonas sp. RIT-PI-S TaxID=3035295 RepID=UPI0021D8B7B4|nr:DUF2934 domain-containing protein [Pseudomonas sp. RIT-PI-S]